MTWYSWRSPNCCNKDAFCIPFIFNKCTCGILVLSPFISFFALKTSSWSLYIFCEWIQPSLHENGWWTWGLGPFGHGLLLPQLQTHLAPQPPRHRRAPQGVFPWRTRWSSTLALWEVQLYVARRDLDVFGWGITQLFRGFSPQKSWLGNGGSTS